MESTVRDTSVNITSKIKFWNGDFSQLVQLMQQRGRLCHFYMNPNPNFPSHEVAYYECKGHSCHINVNFMGLIGHHGALPIYYQGRVLDAIRERNHALYDFINIYQHKLISLTYKVWLSARPTVRSSAATNTIMQGLSGILSGQLNYSNQLLSYGGLLRRQPLSRGTIESILNDYFGFSIRVHDFQSHYIYLEKGDMSRLSMQACTLGKDTLLGKKILQRQGKCTVNIGPLKLKEFSSLLPHGESAHVLRHLLRNLIPAQFDVRVRLWLKSKAVPIWRLDKRAPQRLGLTTWCSNGQFLSNVGDVVYMIT